MVTSENGARQIVETLRTVVAQVSLAFRLRVVVAVFDDVFRAAERASGHRISCTVRKHLASSINSWMLNIRSSLTGRFGCRGATGSLRIIILQAAKSDHPDFQQEPLDKSNSDSILWGSIGCKSYSGGISASGVTWRIRTSSLRAAMISSAVKD